MASRPKLAQKNFALGGAKVVFERWCALNGLHERKAFLASMLAFQSLEPGQQQSWLQAVERWENDDFRHDEAWRAVVGATPTSPQRPAEKVPSRGSRRAAS